MIDITKEVSELALKGMTRNEIIEHLGVKPWQVKKLNHKNLPENIIKALDENGKKRSIEKRIAVNNPSLKEGACGITDIK